MRISYTAQLDFNNLVQFLVPNSRLIMYIRHRQLSGAPALAGAQPLVARARGPVCPSLAMPLLEISKELIRDCLTVPGCYCIPLLHNHLIDLCSYIHKNTLRAAKGGCPSPPPKSATVVYSSIL